MADPELKILPANEWSIIAQSITAGVIHRVSSTPQAYYTFYKAKGGSAPVGLNIGERRLTDSERISSKSQIDVYIYPLNAEGIIRIDL